MNFKLKSKKALGIALSAIAAFVVPVVAFAQLGGGIAPSAFFKLVGTALVPASATWTLGGSGNRILAGYFTTIDATSLAVGGTVSGDLVVSGNAYVYGSSGVNTPYINATSTGLSMSVAGRSVFTGNVTTTGGITPATSGGASIGSSTYPYANGYFSGLISLPKSAVGVPAMSFPGGTGDTNTGVYSPSDDVIGFGANGISVVWDAPNSTFKPGSNNTRDLGALGAAWRNVYASGTYFGGAGSASIPTYAFPDGSGIYQYSAGTLGVSLSGTSYMQFGAGTTAIGNTNNTYSFNNAAFSNNGGVAIGTTAAPFSNGIFSGTVSSTNVLVGGGAALPASVTGAFIGSGTTSTVQIGNSGKKGCFALGDSDGSGITYLTVNDGVATFSTTACNP